VECINAPRHITRCGSALERERPRPDTA
jgi:hypothetical protein